MCVCLYECEYIYVCKGSRQVPLTEYRHLRSMVIRQI